MSEVPYLAKAASGDWLPCSLSDVAEAIERSGVWEHSTEWRISTFTTYRIEPVSRDGERCFEASANCDCLLTCYTPTLERAIEYLGVFDRLTRDMFWTLGWASWATKDTPEPEAGETLPPPE